MAATAQQLVEDEVLALVGDPWSRKGASPLRRGGPCPSRIFLDGEPLVLERTRVRDQQAKAEYPLQSLRVLQSRDALDEDVKRLLVRGGSTRNYEQALTSLSDGLGLQKSAVSSAFMRASQKDLDALNGRPLGEWTFAVVYLDGVVLAEHTALVAMGITLEGDKRILGGGKVPARTVRWSWTCWRACRNAAWSSCGRRCLWSTAPRRRARRSARAWDRGWRSSAASSRVQHPPGSGTAHARGRASSLTRAGRRAGVSSRAWVAAHCARGGSM